MCNDTNKVSSVVKNKGMKFEIENQNIYNEFTYLLRK